MDTGEVTTPSPAPECTMCFGPHDPDIHEATVSIHNWLRQEIERRTREEDFAAGATVEAVAAAICEPQASRH